MGMGIFARKAVYSSNTEQVRLYSFSVGILKSPFYNIQLVIVRMEGYTHEK